MSTLEPRRWLAAGLFAAAALTAHGAGPRLRGPNLGQPIDPATAAAPYPSIFPDGRGLPPGSGTARAGAMVYASHCVACHGEAGRGSSAEHLTSDGALTGPEPDRAINNYWPYATTLFDFTRRAMPMNAPGSLSDDEVYAVTAYLLSLGNIVGADDVLNAETLPKIRMPNRDGFVWIDVPNGAPKRR